MILPFSGDFNRSDVGGIKIRCSTDINSKSACMTEYAKQALRSPVTSDFCPLPFSKTPCYHSLWGCHCQWIWLPADIISISEYCVCCIAKKSICKGPQTFTIARKKDRFSLHAIAEIQQNMRFLIHFHIQNS